MIVIADTSPLNYFILLGHAEALRSLYGHVIIPQAVAHELDSLKTPTLVREWFGRRPDWLEVRKVAGSLDAELAKLDDGEREAILLAEELRADALILDERAGRREAERRKIRVIGTIRVLDDAAEAGLVELPAALQHLRHLGFYLDQVLVQFLLERHAEREKREAGEQA
jgi:predicted nucleic acid-binding protein